MNVRRTHRKVWLAWGRWWAVQILLFPTVSLGVRLELDRPLLDVYVGPLTVAVGRRPLITPEVSRHGDSCRGFCFEEVL